MRELSLFTGAGGGLLGTKLLGWESVGYVEFNEYCQRVLAQRIEDGILDEAPIFGDVREFILSGAAEQYRGIADVVSAGFPCQPFSVAGKRSGESDDRNLWPETLAVLRAVRPRYALLENVPGLLAHEYARRIFGDLAESGFDAQWRVLSAAECGAPHKRDRVWILAAYQHETWCSNYWRFGGEPCDCGYEDAADTIRCACGYEFDAACGRYGCPNCLGEAMADAAQYGRGQGRQGRLAGEHSAIPNAEGALADGGSVGLENQCEARPAQGAIDRPGDECDSSWWAIEPDVGRVADGVAHRVDRLKAIGNGQVPAVVASAWGLLNDGG